MKTFASSAISSQQVSWWDVHSSVAPWLQIVGSWPTVGTPAWCALPDGNPAKLAALYDAAQHWALRLETCQVARADASKAIAGPYPIEISSWGPEEDGQFTVRWAAIAQEIREIREFYAKHPYLKRAAS
jgi:hypothetical protein